jgi:hypothetical protein
MPLESESRTRIIQEFGRPPVYLGAGEDVSPWVPWQPGVSIRHDHYVSWCRERGLKLNEQLWI